MLLLKLLVLNLHILDIVGAYRHSNLLTFQASLNNLIALTISCDLTLNGRFQLGVYHPLWGVIRLNSAGRIIGKAIHTIVSYQSHFTFPHPIRSSTLIDLAIAFSSLATLCEYDVLQDTHDSDHYPVFELIAM